MVRIFKLILWTGIFTLFTFYSFSQTSAVEFGQTRIQYKNFKWRYYQTQNFNTYFSQNGLDLGKFVAQEAERQLPQIEKYLDYGLRSRINIVIYNNYGEMKQSNIGIGIDWQNTGGVTKLVGNKMIVYYNGDHNNLILQIRQGIAQVILQNMLFGDNVGEFASNAVLLYLPKWFTDGFVAYTAQDWDADLDADLKAIILSGRYNDFNQFAFEQPTLAGHAFWHYVEMKYNKSTASYLLYIARIDRNLKKAVKQVLHQSYKDVTRDFMLYYQRAYLQDNRGRRQLVRGSIVTVKEISPKEDFYKFYPRPVGRNNYVYVDFKKGIYRVYFYQGFYTPTLLYKSGVRMMKASVNPSYPQIAWDPKGTRIAVLYEKEGSLQLMLYDITDRLKSFFPMPFESVNSFSFLRDYNTLLLSAVKNGHSDIYTYNIATGKIVQITNDVFDDLDPSYVAFPKKSGIIYASNRPSADATSADTVLPHSHYNIFLINDWDNPERQITQLTDMKRGDARLPMQYSDTYFTFISNENGISNRYAGFFRAEAAGVDSLFYIGETVLHNPDQQELDSTLADYGTKQPDSIRVIAITKDSTYVFPMTNYSYGITESNIAGENQQISEVVRQNDFNRVYKLKTDTTTLQRRNISTRPTNFVQYELKQDSMSRGLPQYYIKPDTAKKPQSFFQSEFGVAKPDTLRQSPANLQQGQQLSILKNAKLFPYHLKFSSDYLITQLNNSVLFTQYQEFTGGGPIELEDPLNGLIEFGVSDLFEDIKFQGGLQVPSSLNGSEYFFDFQNLKHIVDWKLLYYRKVEDGGVIVNNAFEYGAKLKTNLYQAEFDFPIDEVRSVRAQVGVRTDRTVVLAEDQTSLTLPDYNQTYGVLHLEYVYDNTINPATNIWNGLRFKVYGEMFPQLNKPQTTGGSAFTFDAGTDVRYYLPIYRNFIWATRLAAGFSWGTRKVVYYLGGVDNWLSPKFDNNTPIDQNGNYAYQTLAENLRGYDQNIKNGTNFVLLNTELRLPVFSTFIETPINSDLIRNFEITSFIDVGTAWTGGFSLRDNSGTYYGSSPVVVKVNSGILGPFAAGYGFGARTTLLGYFLRFDAGWPSTGFFSGAPKLYFALGVDF
jgi:hypothetical protein